MSKKRNRTGKQSTPFVVAPDGERLVELRAVMHPLVAVVDGLTLSFFPGDKKAYLRIETAIEWVEKELLHLEQWREPERGKYEQMLTALKTVRDAEESTDPVTGEVSFRKPSVAGV